MALWYVSETNIKLIILDNIIPLLFEIIPILEGKKYEI